VVGTRSSVPSLNGISVKPLRDKGFRARRGIRSHYMLGSEAVVRGPARSWGGGWRPTAR